MKEVASEAISLAVLSPPYYNAEHDYKNTFTNYEEYLDLPRCVARELWRVIAKGRIAAVVIDDMLVDGVKYPIVADTTKIFTNAGFDYRDRITWKKPDGYAVRSHRSGVQVQHPYPMYYRPDNLTESILIFQKGKFDYKSVPEEIREQSRMQLEAYLQRNRKWHLNLWEITNVLPGSRLEKGIAAFPQELATRLIILYSYVGETVLDCFLGSGTTMKAALELQRNSIGVEINKHLLPTIRKKIRTAKTTTPASFIIIERLTPSSIPPPKPVTLPPPGTVQQSTEKQVPLTLLNEPLRESR
jgi:site-specific DNA-methyltransferase (adenine-specific)